MHKSHYDFLDLKTFCNIKTVQIARGQGECARLLLAYGGEGFEDKRYSLEEFRRTVKNTMPNGQLPVLEVDGKKLSQSEAIYRFLGREYNLYGKNNWEASVIDSIMGQYKDFFDQVKDFVLTAAGYAEKGDLDTLRQDLFDPASKKFFPILQKYIKESGNGYLTESGPTWIDFFFAEEFDGINYLSPGFYDLYHEFKELSAKIHALPKLQAYLKSRPQSDL